MGVGDISCQSEVGELDTVVVVGRYFVIVELYVLLKYFLNSWQFPEKAVWSVSSFCWLSTVLLLYVIQFMHLCDVVSEDWTEQSLE